MLTYMFESCVYIMLTEASEGYLHKYLENK